MNLQELQQLFFAARKICFSFFSVLLTIGIMSGRIEENQRKSLQCRPCKATLARGAAGREADIAAELASERKRVDLLRLSSASETGPFSAVSTPIVMRNSLFFSIFQNLQEFTSTLLF